MKVNREQAIANREKVLKVASEQFKERGLDGISVVDLMNKAGLTHGGFYSQFKSKEALTQEVCVRAMTNTKENWQEVIDKATEAPLADLAEYYLTPAHRKSVNKGCPLAAMGNDVARKNGSVRRIFSNSLNDLIAAMSKVTPGGTEEKRKKIALSAISEMVGGIILSRIMEDETEAIELMDAVREDLIKKSAS